MWVIIRSIPRKIKKIIQYIPILWKDEDWDWEYILTLLIYKLKRTRLCILNNEIIESYQIVHDEILEVEKLFEKVIEDNYYSDEIQKLHEKWGELDILNIMKYSNVKNEEDEKRCSNEFSKVYKKQQEGSLQDLKKAFELVNEKIRGWWD